MFSRTFVKTIARAFTGGEQSELAIEARCRQVLGHLPAWLQPLIAEYRETYPRPPRTRAVVSLLRERELEIVAALPSGDTAPPLLRGLAAEPVMNPVPAARQWPVPTILTPGDLADWLSITPGELDWLAGRHGMSGNGHYRYRILEKRSGGQRLIEAPKQWLKAIQRRILDRILAAVPPHPSAHGFLPGRSIVTFAGPHAGQHVVLRMDLEDFFPSISRARVHGWFRALGYPEAVADLLGCLCTNSVPRQIFPELDDPHLPQGAPSSPALANLCAWHADCRLSGLAKSAGAVYGRYADDLVFSGDPGFARNARTFSIHAAAILLEEGFMVNHRKTRILRRGVRQIAAGLVVNDRVNVPRRDVEQLEAILTNCVRHGPGSQNRANHPYFRGHLLGRISFVEMVNPARGAKLRAIFQKIEWPTSAKAEPGCPTGDPAP